jgi:hypothetical protein
VTDVERARDQIAAAVVQAELFHLDCYLLNKRQAPPR